MYPLQKKKQLSYQTKKSFRTKPYWRKSGRRREERKRSCILLRIIGGNKPVKEPATKTIYITPRDHDFLEDLYNLVFLDVDYLKKVIYLNDGKPVSDAVIYRRTTLLEKNGFITSFRLPVIDKACPSGRSKKVYFLDSKGVEEVRELIGEARWDSPWTERAPLHIYHALETADIKASFVTSESPHVELHEWISERRSYFKSEEGGNIIRPDGMIILRGKSINNNVGFFLEVERSRQKKEINMNKLKRYNRYCVEQDYKKHDSIDVQIPAPRIIFASSKKTEMIKLIEHTKEVITYATSGVLYTTIEQIKNDPYGKIFYAKGSTNPDQLYSLLDSIV
jgi:DNA-binding PadR family transcriptional regulator